MLPCTVRFISTLLSRLHSSFRDKHTMANPVDESTPFAARIASEGPEFWIQPCGYQVTGNSPPSPDAALAESYALQLNLAINNIDNWKNEYVSTSHSL